MADPPRLGSVGRCRYGTAVPHPLTELLGYSETRNSKFVSCGPSDTYTFVLLLVALFAIAQAHPQVNVVDGQDQVHVVDGQDQVHVVDGDNGVNVVDGPANFPTPVHIAQKTPSIAIFIARCVTLSLFKRPTVKNHVSEPQVITISSTTPIRVLYYEVQNSNFVSYCPADGYIIYESERDGPQPRGGPGNK
ncbi:hypothetical protein MSG28_008760 [Choristoneura fumiferana]|uniref:Uncharacterized protein n=1 Tax=Choristoneura fumiferana TaxID=7141 RepID=A0ACC0J7X1_CHOFU|nr:hypothetical protein MSG28_008760 [Choristoneura fumiferana]